jgi:hypothetical protein
MDQSLCGAQGQPPHKLLVLLVECRIFILFYPFFSQMVLYDLIFNQVQCGHLDCNFEIFFFKNFFEVPLHSSFGSRHSSIKIIIVHSYF